MLIDALHNKILHKAAFVAASLCFAGCASGQGANARDAGSDDRTEVVQGPGEEGYAVSAALNTARQRIADISSSPVVKAAFTTIEEMDARNIERLIAINEIAAPPFGEERRGVDLVRRLKAAGLDDVTTDAVGNVVARRAGKTGEQTIAIVAHIDTVFPIETNVTVRRKGDVFFAPGIGDNTRGVVVMLSLIDALEAHDIETEADLLFIGSVGEEGLGDLRGVRHLFREGGPRIDSFIAIDGGRQNRIVNKAVGSTRYRVTFKGPGGHSWGAFGLAHPHQALAEAISNFTEAALPITEGKPKATFSVGRIGGGTSVNSIPFSSWMEVDMRSADPEKLNQLDAAFQRAIDDALKTENGRHTSNDALEVELKSVGKRPAGFTSPSDSLVLNARAAMEVFDIEPLLTASSTDANIPMSLGVPALTMSRGGITRNAHALNESWSNKDAHLAIQIVLMTVLAEAGLVGAASR